MSGHTHQLHRFTNHLIHETSPYLLQHAHNPVEWYPWSDEALQRARNENRPILLSIGYSACHWCHVMERESFENEEIAALMNERFICIKVDREERPDLDYIYQTVGQMLTGQGGWPLTMFLTPELEPFWGGTYFPPEDRYGRPGFARIVTALAEHYATEPGKITEAVSEIRRALADYNQSSGPGAVDAGVVASAAVGLARAFDSRSGGFGGQPKFPNTMSLEVFLRHFNHTDDREYLHMFRLALRKMAEGGIYDQLGGGFHRYSTDDKWLIPHFEKMLYDNALLARSYVQAFQVTGDGLFERVVHETLGYVLREMVSPEGGFYSAQDADSEGEEGKYFAWTPAEIQQSLTQQDAEIFSLYYGVTQRGNFEHAASVLSIVETPENLARDFGISIDEVEASLSRSRARLFEIREQRIKPALDDKILVSWNGLMISAFAEAGKVFSEPRYILAASAAANFILERMCVTGLLNRSFGRGRASGEGYLEDYAFFTAGLIELYEATGDARWIDQASVLLETMLRLFRDDKTGDFYLTPQGATNLIVRPRQAQDQSIPSGVSFAAMNLLKLSSILDRPDLRTCAEQVFAANAEEIGGNPHGSSSLISAFDFYQNGPVEVVVLADRATDSTRAALQQFYRHYRPNQVTAVAAPGAEVPPIVKDKAPVGAEVTAYVCRNFSCSAPITSWEELDRALSGE